MYVVAGVTGNTGSIVAEELLQRGHQVRAIVRDVGKGERWKAMGAEVAVTSLADAKGLAEVLSGAKGAYLLNPPDMTISDFRARATEIGDAFTTAIRDSGVPQIVFLSSIGAQHDSGVGPIAGLHLIEKKLEGLGIGETLLRPAYFLENWGVSLGSAVSEGVLPSFLPENFRFPQVATRDIGRLAADALENPPRGISVLEISGPEDYTPADIARAVGSIAGREVAVGVGPIEAVIPTFTSFGASEHVASLFREMYEGMVNGRISWDGSGQRIRGTTTPAEVFAPMLR